LKILFIHLHSLWTHHLCSAKYWLDRPVVE
jgi:hypothetical protein